MKEITELERFFKSKLGERKPNWTDRILIGMTSVFRNSFIQQFSSTNNVVTKSFSFSSSKKLTSVLIQSLVVEVANGETFEKEPVGLQSGELEGNSFTIRKRGWKPDQYYSLIILNGEHFVYVGAMATVDSTHN